MPRSNSVCVRPEDVTPKSGLSSFTSGLTDEPLIDKNGASLSSAFVGTHRMKLIRQVYEAGGTHFPHQHPSTEQAYYILEGTARVRVGDESFDVEAGTVIYLPPNTPHEMINTGEGRLVNLLICGELDADEVKTEPVPDVRTM